MVRDLTCFVVHNYFVLIVFYSWLSG